MNILKGIPKEVLKILYLFISLEFKQWWETITPISTKRKTILPSYHWTQNGKPAQSELTAYPSGAPEFTPGF